MSRLKKYLTEKTFAIDKDVELLYDKSGIEDLFKAINRGDEDYVYSFLNSRYDKSSGETIFFKSTSAILKNRNSKQAHKVNPVDIRIGSFFYGSYYDINKKVIQVSIHSSALDMIMKNRLDFGAMKFQLGVMFDRFKSEFSPASFKGTIAHELTHWIDDSLHNEFITKRVNKAKEKGEQIKGNLADVNHSNFEVNSQIHAMKSIRKGMKKKEFDKINWETFFKLKSSFVSNFKNFRTEDDYDKFVKAFVSRLHREKILPKGMQRILTWKEMKYLLSNI